VQGAGRIDNPDVYRTLYCSDDPAGAVAEAFGNLAIWTDVMLSGPPSLPGSVRALGVYDSGEARILDLDDARRLLDRRLKPSQVATRNRDVTQRWALAAYQEQRWAGIRWWSYHESSWGSFGLWELSGVRVLDVSPLHREHLAVVLATQALSRTWEAEAR